MSVVHEVGGMAGIQVVRLAARARPRGGGAARMPRAGRAGPGPLRHRHHDVRRGGGLGRAAAAGRPGAPRRSRSPCGGGRRSGRACPGPSSRSRGCGRRCTAPGSSGSPWAWSSWPAGPSTGRWRGRTLLLVAGVPVASGPRRRPDPPRTGRAARALPGVLGRRADGERVAATRSRQPPAPRGAHRGRHRAAGAGPLAPPPVDPCPDRARRGGPGRCGWCAPSPSGRS